MEKNNYPVEILCEDIPYDLKYLRNGNENIEWEIFCKILLNTRKIWNDDDYINLGIKLVEWRTYPVLSSLAGLFLNVKEIYYLAADEKGSVGKQLFKCVISQIQEIDTSQLQIKLELPPDYTYSLEFFLITKGFYIAAPRLIKLKASNVLMQQTKNGSIYSIIYPPSHNIFSRIRNISTSLFYKKAAMEEQKKSYKLLNERYYQLEENRTQIEKQAKLLETANSISHFISSDLDLDLTLEALTKVLIEIAGFIAVEVKIDSTVQGEQIKSFVSFGRIPESVDPIQRTLSVHGHKIGEIFLWSCSEVNLSEINQLLDLIIPTISIDTFNAISYKLVNDYRNKLELKVAERTAQLKDTNLELATAIQKLKDMQTARDRFFTGISHEFRTPLLLIKGPLEQMMKDNIDTKNLERYTMVNRNIENLQTLINQLLELSQLESSSIPLKAQKVNLLTLLKGLTFAFESLAKERNINLRFENSEEAIYTWIDKEKFEKIINNLLANAFKFTKSEGRINISLERVIIDQKEYAEIIVSDTGIGIPQAKLEKIFERFYQVDDSSQRTFGGSGIGLSLVKELVDLHRWNISVTSQNERGTEFYLKIPLDDDYLDENQKIDQAQTESTFIESGTKISHASVRKKVNEDQIVNEIADGITQDNKPNLLIVEDSKDVQDYLDDLLNSGYSVSTALNGLEGLKIAQEKIPDLIISDVMMPEMDGFEFCQKIKTDERTSHIPLILLTAKATSKDKITGLETGAEDYIMKPFEANELKVRIRNLIDQRKKLREYFKKQSAFDLTEAKVTSVDRKFLEKILNIINNHISDAGFSVDAFADEIGMSRSQLHRKLVSLIGESPGDLIRRIRLTKAAKLIEQNFGNISEIALEVGFNNPANFAQSFKKQFGVSPTEYKK